MPLTAWPMYFAKQPLETGRLKLAVGDPFPVQHKQVIRGLGAAYGVANAMDVPFNELPYVEIVDVVTQGVAEEVEKGKLPAAKAKLRARQAHAEVLA